MLEPGFNPEVAAATLFVALVASPTISSEVTRVEVSYFTAALVLCGMLWAVYRRGPVAGRADPAVVGGVTPH